MNKKNSIFYLLGLMLASVKGDSDNKCVRRGKECILKSSIDPNLVGLADPIYSVCYVNNEDKCYYDETEKQCKWNYTEEFSRCICSMNDNFPKEKCDLLHCSHKELGYPCCAECSNTIYTDEDGVWGFENGEWCGIQEICKNITGKCKSELAGIPCCDSCLNDGRTIYENIGDIAVRDDGTYCGVLYECNEEPTEIPTELPIPTEEPPIPTDEPTEVPVDKTCVRRGKKCILESSIDPDLVGMADPIHYVCYVNNEDKCYYDETEKQCKWNYTDEFNQCICAMGKNSQNENCNKPPTCKTSKLGYKCCSDCTVYYTDEDGDWGIENGEWCVIQDKCKNNTGKCKSELAGIPCCDSCLYDGRTIYENIGDIAARDDGTYCGVLYECNEKPTITEEPTTEPTPTEEPTDVPIPTEEPTDVPTEVPVDNTCVVTGKKCVLESSIDPDSVGMADPIHYVCHDYYKENCIFDETEKKCKWEYTEGLKDCLCETNNTKISSTEELDCNYYTCDQKKLESSGYKCCADCSCLSHTVVDSKGIWGYNTKDGSKCVIPKQCEKAYNKCTSEKVGIQCCDHCEIGRYHDQLGVLGLDKNENWCGIPFSCKNDLPEEIPDDFCVQKGIANELCVRKDDYFTEYMESTMSEKYAKCFENQGSNCAFNDRFKRCKWNLTEEMNKCICEVSKSEGIEDDYHCKTTRYKSSVNKYLEMECCDVMTLDLQIKNKDRVMKYDDYEVYGLDDTDEQCVYRNNCKKGEYALIPIDPVRECEYYNISACKVKDSGYNSPFKAGIPNPVNGLCYSNFKENCVLDESNNCNWKYTEEMNACLCELSEGENSYYCKKLQCPHNKLGYKCCNKCDVVYTDSDGQWGVERGEWCGIRESCRKVASAKPFECGVQVLGYQCCKDCESSMKTPYGSINFNFGTYEYCGIPNSCKN